MPRCSLTGQSFDSSDFELKIRSEFGMPEATTLPHLRIRHLWAFWPHWSLHKRKCDKTGRDIVSVFRSECPYPVWHKDEWYASALPPSVKVDFDQPFFTQAETLFKRCPIPHNSWLNNENCEFSDDCWFSRNCYLSHSVVRCENNRYSYRILDCRNTLYAVFSFECEWCFDIINSEKCNQCVYGLYLKNCHDVAFCYDCRNCHDCLFCFNLRGKQYCIGNKQLSKEEYEIQKKQFPFDTWEKYEHCKDLFRKMIREIAWHRSHYLDFAENSSGNYFLRVKNMSNTFFGSDGEDGSNVTRFGWTKTVSDSINLQDAERILFSSGIQIKSYEVGFSFMLESVRFGLYSGYSSRCENIFGCCGLLNAKNAIMNASYSLEEYSTLRDRLIDHMKSTGEWGKFFPGSFAPNPYAESWSSFYFPLTQEGEETLWFFSLPLSEQHEQGYRTPGDIPRTTEATLETTQATYWDEIAHRPFQILPQDIQFCTELGVPLPSTYYMRRIQENFWWMPYNGTLRTTKCAKSWKDIQTSWPAEYDGRILSEAEYLKIVG